MDELEMTIIDIVLKCRHCQGRHESSLDWFESQSFKFICKECNKENLVIIKIETTVKALL